jgi:hypothetical protein
MPFKNKPAKEQGIDLTRKFKVVEESVWSPKIGDILEIKEDDDTNYPRFWNLTANRIDSNKHPTEDKWWCLACWDQLEYADEEKCNCEACKTPKRKIKKVVVPAGYKWYHCSMSDDKKFVELVFVEKR